MNNKFIKASLLCMTASLLFITANAAYANQDSNWDAMDQAPEAQAPAEGGCAVGNGGGCATGNCEIPPDADSTKSIQLPDQTTVEETKVIPTSEQQVATDVIDYHTTKHVYHPEVNNHTVNKHRKTINRHFTKIVHHPTKRRVNNIVRTNEEMDQTMPVEEVVEPVIDYGCAAEAPPAPMVQPVIVPVIRPVVYGYGMMGGFPYLY